MMECGLWIAPVIAAPCGARATVATLAGMPMELTEAKELRFQS